MTRDDNNSNKIMMMIIIIIIIIIIIMLGESSPVSMGRGSKRQYKSKQ